MNIKIISAGAGSGKTYRLTSEMVELLKEGVRANGIIATTFTQKAAAELQERVRVRLLKEGLTQQAEELTNALIGTVHGLGVKLLKRFAYEAGVSPEVDIIAEEDQQVLFNQSLATVLTEERVETMEELCARFGLNNDYFDWRKEVRFLTEVARANDFSEAVLEKSKVLSFSTFQAYLGEESDMTGELFYQRLAVLLDETITRLENNEDSTKVTGNGINTLKGLQRELRLRKWLPWSEWARIGKLKVGARSRDETEALINFANSHETNPAFHKDIRDFIFNLFDLTLAAIKEYDHYKKRRGLIDYTDMEVLVNRMLDDEQVGEVLRQELDLLMVDEFQDTSPIQLEIFLKLSRLAGHSIWVGDPKQSIYGFRGADPRLMQAVIEKMGGVKPEDIQAFSWRSRQDIVFAANAIFTKAFSYLPPEQVALQPVRCKTPDLHKDCQNQAPEPIEVDDALIHWHFEHDGEGRRQPGRPWMENCLAQTVRSALLDSKKYILPKGSKEYRTVQPGDIAILCRSNSACREVAAALSRAGLPAAISQAGLLNTAEATLILACLKYLLNRQDSLSVAELLLLASGWPTEQIIEHRLEFLEQQEEGKRRSYWASDQPVIARLDELRGEVAELSSAEILNLTLEELNLRRIIVTWGNSRQRLENVDVLRKLALKYEEACNRLHTAASLGGFLLWLGELNQKEEDMKGFGEGPEAVNVLTYHRSKGLEWPVVICHNLDQNLRADVWGIDIVPESDEVDLDNVLGGRWLRYWVNPYDRQYLNTPVNNRLAESEVQAEKTRQALREEARLLYVGVTRARDYLVFPTSLNPSKWLNRVWNNDEAATTLYPGTHESPWHWETHLLDIQSETFLYPREFPHAEPASSPTLFLENRVGKQPFLPQYFNLREEKLIGEFSARTGTITQYGPRIAIAEDAEEYPIAKLIKAFLTAYSPEAGLPEMMALAREHIERFELEDSVKTEDIFRAAHQFYQYLDQRYRVRKSYRKYPVRFFHNGRIFDTILDLLLETDRGLVLIQHSGFRGEASKWKNKALELSDWLFLSRLALRELFDEPQVQTLVHFVLGGGLVEVNLTAGSGT